MSAYNQNRRIGSFVAVNSGRIEGCVADIHANFGSESAGFVYENSGEVDSSLTVRVGSKKTNRGFFVRNSGSLENCGYVAGKRAVSTERDGTKIYKFGNPDQYISSDTPDEEILKKLRIDGIWKAIDDDRAFEPDLMANHVAIPEENRAVVEIDSPEALEEVMEKINSGDRKAASASYRLVSDINMKGSKLQPIGISESLPFSGVFDGNGMTISNFTINGAGYDVAGFFGYTRNARVVNLSLDYILKGAKSIVAGGMAGELSGGEFENCRVLLGMSPGRCAGGFAGKNSGHIRNCYVGGKMNNGAVLLPWFLTGGALLLALLVSGTAIFVVKMTRSPYVPPVIDPNQVPVIDDGEKVEPPPAGTSRISLELNQDIYVAASSMVGQMDYINPRRSTQDVVIRLCVTDAELTKRGYDLVACQVRTQEELNAEGYDPTKSYTELYRSGRLQIGYKLSVCKLSALPDGKNLKVGDYDMVMLIDAYDPETNEKAIVNAQAVTTIHIVDQ